MTSGVRVKLWTIVEENKKVRYHIQCIISMQPNLGVLLKKILQENTRNGKQ